MGKASHLDKITVEKKGSIAKKMTVSQSDIKQAKTKRQLDAMQNRIDELPDGMRKKSLQKMLNAQRKIFEKMQADEVDSAQIKAQNAKRSKKMKGKVTTSEAPFDIPAEGSVKKTKGLAKGGMARKKYNKGGYANCGASVKASQKSTKMAYGGMARKK